MSVRCQTLGNSIHLNFFEDPNVFRERFELYGDGCYVYKENGACLGYCVSHPWIKESPPPLNSLLTKIPNAPDTYYIHDIALDSRVRKKGTASTMVKLVLTHAKEKGFSEISLIAVNNLTGF